MLDLQNHIVLRKQGKYQYCVDKMWSQNIGCCFTKRYSISKISKEKVSNVSYGKNMFLKIFI